MGKKWRARGKEQTVNFRVKTLDCISEARGAYGPAGSGLEMLQEPEQRGRGKGRARLAPPHFNLRCSATAGLRAGASMSDLVCENER